VFARVLADDGVRLTPGTGAPFQQVYKLVHQITPHSRKHAESGAGTLRRAEKWRRLKSFAVQSRIDSRERRETIGRYGIFTVDQARRRDGRPAARHPQRHRP
jgi:hypothetical protein